VIGEKDLWNRGYGTEATRLVVAEAFETHDLTEVRLEVFRHNPRAIRAYQRVGFVITGEHVEWVGRSRRELNVIEMKLRRLDWEATLVDDEPAMTPAAAAEAAVGVTADSDKVDDEGGDTGSAGESDADRAARLERRRARRQYRRLLPASPAEPAPGPESNDEPKHSIA
jgi:hypothetical protein